VPSESEAIVTLKRLWLPSSAVTATGSKAAVCVVDEGICKQYHSKLDDLHFYIMMVNICEYQTIILVLAISSLLVLLALWNKWWWWRVLSLVHCGAIPYHTTRAEFFRYESLHALYSRVGIFVFASSG
jgi:hypothetical protein